MTKQLSNHAAAAAAIRAQLKAAGVKGSVKAESYAGGCSVRVRLAECLPATKREVEAFANQYQYGHFDGMDDSYKYSNRRDDLPQVTYVFVDVDYSPETWEAAKAYTVANDGENWEDYSNGSDRPWMYINGALPGFWTARKPKVRVVA